MPMRVIGMLLGIPDEDQEALRDSDRRRAEPRGREERKRDSDAEARSFRRQRYSQYIAWRRKNPSDDLMTELINARLRGEGVGAHAARRRAARLHRVARGRRERDDDAPDRLDRLPARPLPRSATSPRRGSQPRPERRSRRSCASRRRPPVQARYVMQDVELPGRRVREGETVLLLNGAANRDEREFPDADRLDVRRKNVRHLSFGLGIHFCLGASLARLEGCVALEEVLKRWPEWQIDHAEAVMAHTSSVRGWKSLPARVSEQGDLHVALRCIPIRQQARRRRGRRHRHGPRCRGAGARRRRRRRRDGLRRR